MEEYKQFLSGLNQDELYREFSIVKDIRRRVYDELNYKGSTYYIRDKEKEYAKVVEVNEKIDMILTQLGNNIFGKNKIIFNKK